MIPASQDKCWVAIQVKARNKLAAAEVLRNKGYEELVPVYSQSRTWSDRRKILKSPLFPGYVFCRFDSGLAGLILTTPGVIRTVGSRKEPWPVDENEIRALQAVVKAGIEPQPHVYLAAGTRAVIMDGPLAGIEGFVSGYRNHLILSVHLIQQSLVINVAPCSVSAMANPSLGTRTNHLRCCDVA